MVKIIKSIISRISTIIKGRHFKRFNLKFIDYYELFISMINYFNLTKGVDRKQFMTFAKGLIDIYGKPGHYYSPLETISKIEEKKEYIVNKSAPIRDIHIDLSEQLELLNHLKEFNNLIPFDNDQLDCIYHPDNNYFPRTDASILFSMIMYLKPKRIIEVGSGFSSALMLDTNRIYFNNSIDLKCIEPYPNRLLSLLKEEDKSAVEIFDSFIQDIDIAFFKHLDKNDILFIDSSHISKVLSDVNFIIFEIMPQLNRNVYIHFHDSYFPFEYPLKWYREGKFYNEAYILRAFLQNNENFKITFWANYLTNRHIQKVKDVFPSIKENTGGSIWIKKN